MVKYNRTPVLLKPPVYFVSDAHLGAADIDDPESQLLRLLTLLDVVQERNGSLVLVGDIFDFWFEWKHVIPKQHFALLHRLRTLADHGVPIHFLAGNHDFRIHGFLETEVGIKTHQDAAVLQIADSLIFAFHGDGILAKDHGYRLLKKVLRNKICQFLFSWIHPDLGMLLARGTSMTSRNSTKGNPEQDHEYIAFANAKFNEGFRGVVMGHAHRPMQIDEGANTYVNLGDWILHYTFAVHDGTRLTLEKFHDHPELEARMNKDRKTE
jgi:UDP-2,3-diacylglucosamine hydrolase